MTNQDKPLREKYQSNLLNEQVSKLLTELTQTLQLAKLWQTDKPTEKALASSAPFCCDTLTFTQWLQFIFIPRINLMIKQGQTLPSNIALTPMAEESCKYLTINSTPLLAIIAKIDMAMSQ